MKGLTLLRLGILLAVLAPLAGALAQGDAPTERDRAAGWPADVARLLDEVALHPAIRAAEAAVAAARAELDAVRFPFSVDASVASTRVDATPAEVDLPPPLDVLQTTPEGWSSRVSVSASFRPIVAGDLADLERQRRVAVTNAERSLRETRATLEASAVQAAAALHVAQRGLDTAREGVRLAQRNQTATGTRSARGAATERERERAALETARALEGLRGAEARVAEARASLQALVPTVAPLERIPEPPLAVGVHPAFARAEADAELALVGLSSAERALLPTVHASYAWNADGGSVALSMESRTFQPTVTYESPGVFSGSAGGLPLPPDTQPSIEGSLTVGLQMRFSADDHYAREAAAARVAAARAGVAAARSDAALAGMSRREAVRAARAALALAEQEHALLGKETEDVRRRLELGLEIPLAAAGDELALAQSELAVLSARLDLLSALLRSYRELAVPLSEVRP